MSIDNFYNHRCDIYHLCKSEMDFKYGLKNNNQYVKNSYNDNPDLENIKCHFYIKGTAGAMSQLEPQNVLNRVLKTSFPLGTDIRLNDKIVDTTLDNPTNGMDYTVQFVYKVQEHHLVAVLFRENVQKVL